MSALHPLEAVARGPADPLDADARAARAAIAGALREAVELARVDGHWLWRLNGVFLSTFPSPFERLVERLHTVWLTNWGLQDPRAGDAVGGFLDLDADPVERFGRFVRAAEAAHDSGLAERRPAAVFLIGSLLNFAVEPQRLPMIRPRVFAQLRESLGQEGHRLPLVPYYEAQLEFLGRVREEVFAREGRPVDVEEAEHRVFTRCSGAAATSKAVPQPPPSNGSHTIPTPPPELAEFVGGEFWGVGRLLRLYLTHLCELRPEDNILDVGCGVGRAAAALVSHLDERGGYEGFDVSPECIAWCQDNIESQCPNFRFRLADIYNKQYNPEGKLKAADFAFPYPSSSFDVVCAASVFTHMFPDDVEHYFAEISRVLKPGGRLFSSFFALNADSVAAVERGSSEIALPGDCGTYRVSDPDVPEAVVALPEDFIRTVHTRNGLVMRQPIHYGHWSGRTSFLTLQDFVVADRE